MDTSDSRPDSDSAQTVDETADKYQDEREDGPRLRVPFTRRDALATVVGLGGLGLLSGSARAGHDGAHWQSDVDADGHTLFDLGALEMTNNPTFGTTDGTALEGVVSDERFLRVAPTASDEAPNIIAGHPSNTVTWSRVHGATIGGGGQNNNSNTVGGRYGTVGGGVGNNVVEGYGTIGGGRNNQVGSTLASSRFATVGGGEGNSVRARWATIGGGRNNSASSVGVNGDASRAATIGGGEQNSASPGYQTTVGGGWKNTASGNQTTVGGGLKNTASGNQATVGGGSANKANGTSATIGGGNGNAAVGLSATVGGGGANIASGNRATVGGGYGNEATDGGATIGGGRENSASGVQATVGGGKENTANGRGATVPGGQNNTADGNHTFAAGREADTNGHDGSVVFGDSSSTAITAQNDDEVRSQMVIYAPHFRGTSAREAKTAITSVDPGEVLAGVEQLEVSTWELTETDDGRHMGPMAEDFQNVFQLGNDDESISTVDADGVAMAAIQGLSAKLDEKDKRIADLERENEELQAKYDALNDRVADLEETDDERC